MTEERDLLAAVLASPAEDTPRLMYADWFQEHGQEARAEFIRVQCELARLPEYTTLIGHIVEHDLTPKPVSITALVPRGAVKLLHSHTLWHQNRDDSWYCASGLTVWTEEGFDSERVRVEFLQNVEPDPFAEKRRVLMVRGQELWELGTNGGGFLEIPAHWGRPHWNCGFIDSLDCAAADWLAHADVIRKQHPVTKVKLLADATLQRLPAPADGFHVSEFFPQGELLISRESFMHEISERWKGIEFELPP